MDQLKSLVGKVAIVAGATRHSGRGVAIELGHAGATVYCTGRSVRGHPSPKAKPETIEETAEFVNSYGGKGYWIQVDHTDIAQVQNLFDRVMDEQGRVDILVNCICGGAKNDPFLESDLDSELRAIEMGGRAHLITTHVAAKRMAKAESGLIINVTDHEWDTFYAIEKAMINRIAISAADELRDHGITILSLLPGGFFKCFDIFTEEAHREAVWNDSSILKCHTPRLIGRGVVAMANDPNVLDKTGKLVDLHDLVLEYGLTDIDGRQTGEMW